MATWSELRSAIDSTLTAQGLEPTEEEIQAMYENETLGYIALAYQNLDTARSASFDEYESRKVEDDISTKRDLVGHMFRDLAKGRHQGQQ